MITLDTMFLAGVLLTLATFIYEKLNVINHELSEILIEIREERIWQKKTK